MPVPSKPGRVSKGSQSRPKVHSQFNRKPLADDSGINSDTYIFLHFFCKDFSKPKTIEGVKANAEHIFEQMGPALSRVAASYAPAGAEREDLLQDIALGIVMALPKFREECSLRTFVFRIAHNRGLDHAWKRKQTRERGVDTPAGGEHATEAVHCKERTPEQTAAHRKKLEQFSRALRELPVKQRQVMTLALEGLTHAEVGEVLGIEENNVSVRLHRARAELKKALGGQDG